MLYVEGFTLLWAITEQIIYITVLNSAQNTYEIYPTKTYYDVKYRDDKNYNIAIDQKK